MAVEVTPAAVMAIALDVMSAPWVWGWSDCSSAACDVFQRLHGVDPLAPLRGRYQSAAEAKALQGDDWPATCADLAARARLVASDGRTGDLGLVRGVHGLSLAICVKDGQWVGKTLGGMRTTRAAEYAWGLI